MRRLALAVGLVGLVIGLGWASPASAQVVVKDYRFPAEFNDYISDEVTELWARVYRPTFTGTTKYPLIVMLHGQHGTCGRNGTTPRDDDDSPQSSQYGIDGTCPANYSVVKSHEGYGYLASDLASRGYIVVSINSNRGFAGIFPRLRERGRLVLWHLGQLYNWNQGATPTPPSLEVSFQNRIDFSQVGLMGHSRGALGMRSAIVDYRDSNEIWQFVIPNMTIRSLLEMSPPGFGGESISDAYGVHFLHLVGTCDGELANYGDQTIASPHFDRHLMMGSELNTVIKAQYGIFGANHRYFNTEWQQNDTPRGCANQTPLFTGGATETGSQSQRDAALAAVRGFFLATVGVKHDPSQARIFDPAYTAPAGPTIARSFSPSPSFQNTLRLDEFDNARGFNSNGVANNWNGLSDQNGNTQLGYDHFHSYPQHDSNYYYAHLEWRSASTNNYFQTNWLASGSGWDLRTYQYLEFRVEQNMDQATTEFNVQLVGSNDVASSSINSGSYVALTKQPGSITDRFESGMTITTTYYHPLFRTVRIPLNAFTGINLASVRGARFVFNRTTKGRIALASLNASRDMNLARWRPATVSSVQDNNATLGGDKAVDGSTSSRWSSAFSDAQWIYFDLGSIRTFNTVILRWEAAYGKNFKLQTSNNATSWTDIATVTNGTGGTQTFNLATTASGRYVRMLGSARGTQYGYSLYEFEIYQY